MKNGRPNIGVSNIYWSKIDRKRQQATAPPKPEELEDPVVVDTMELDLVDRIQVKSLSDNFCPPDLTKVKQPVILLTSPTTMENTNE
jgi:hypothetical protein